MIVGEYKIGVKEYYKPTPKIFRIVGDALLTISGIGGAISAFTLPPWATVMFAICGPLSKFCTNLATTLEK
jgi:hypothetical protein